MQLKKYFLGAIVGATATAAIAFLPMKLVPEANAQSDSKIRIEVEGKCAMAHDVSTFASATNLLLNPAAALAAKGYKVITTMDMKSDVYVLGCK